jgi:alpha-N-arabinofuranosidase
MPARVRAIAEAHRQYRKTIESLKDKEIKIALDEWNYWYGPHLYGELGVRYHLKDALGVAAALNEFIRNSDIYYMANYAQTVNVIGCIKTTKTAAAFATTGLVLKLYRSKFEKVAVAVTVPEPLDAAAAVSECGTRLTLAVVNPLSQPLTLGLNFLQGKVRPTARISVISDKGPEAYNEPGKAPAVVIRSSTVELREQKVRLTPFSVTLIEFNVVD